jgi:hypothetical protein
MLPRLLPLLLAACHGSLDPRGQSSGLGDDDPAGPDAGEAAGADATPTGGDPVPDPGCVPIGGANGSGEHNAGLNCMTAGCHDPGGEGPTFTLGGTLYTSVAGTAPQPGALITVRDAANVELQLRTAQNGNFWTGQALTFPLTVAANGCPDVTPMIATVATTGAGCNTTACHDAATNRIHLP